MRFAADYASGDSWDRLEGREEEPLGQSEDVCVFCEQPEFVQPKDRRSGTRRLCKVVFYKNP
jgi:hypothetical protein